MDLPEPTTIKKEIMDSNDSVIPSTSKVNIKSECNSDIRKEVLETNAFKDYLVGLGVSEPVDEKKKPFKCNFCLRGFTRKGNLKEHEEVCKRKQKLTSIAVPSQNLSNDLRNLGQQMDVNLTTHKQKKKLMCEFCSREFKDNSNRRKHMKICKKSDQTIDSECYSDTRKEILESKSFKEYLVGLGEIKSEVSEPSDEFSNSQKPSTSKVKIKSQEEILESKAFKEYVAGLGIVGKRKSEYSEPIQSRKNIKPNLFFPQLIAEALLNSPDGALVISDIFKSISAKHPYYKLENKTWQNTVRCTLTTNVNFTKTSGIEGNKHWTLTFSKSPSKSLNAKLKSDIIKVIGKKQLPKLNAKLKSDMIKAISDKQLPKLPNSKLTIKSPEHQDPTESNLSEDNFVGLCEIKSESSGKNDEFIENQKLEEIDPFEVQTER